MASFYLIRMDGIYQSKEEILSQKNGQQLWDNGIRPVGISRLRLYATVSNLWTITGYDGFDPQTTLNPTSVTSRGYDNGALPRTRSWIVGLNIAF